MLKKLNHENAPVVTVPLGPGGEKFLSSLKQYSDADIVVAGMLHIAQPSLDELFVCQGVSPMACQLWCGGGFRHDALFQKSQMHGTATGAIEHTTLSLQREGGFALMHVLPESLISQRVWWVLLARDEPFTAREQVASGILLKQWQTQWNYMDEPFMGRILLGQDQCLIHADPNTELMLLGQPDFLDQLNDALASVLEQRWPDLPINEPRDFGAKLVGQPYWICFQRCQTINHELASYWHIEFRQIEEDGLTCVTDVGDLRIAKSIAYIHENFHLSPSLNKIAKAVNVSPFHFHRLFTRLVGVSPKQYLQHKQLQLARWMLLYSRMSIGEIATATGFSSHGHFTSTFHRVIGQSPSEYREN